LRLLLYNLEDLKISADGTAQRELKDFLEATQRRMPLNPMEYDNRSVYLGVVLDYDKLGPSEGLPLCNLLLYKDELLVIPGLHGSMSEQLLSRLPVVRLLSPRFLEDLPSL
jgi:hypothetical protein